LKPLKLIFMGTPDFAIPSLDLLKLSAHQIIAVVTPPGRPCGRGKKIAASPAGKWALKHGVETIQPEKVNEDAFLSWLEIKEPDLIVTVAFGRLLPPVILKLPPFGCINLHASYLPAYRGAAPIHRAVIDGAEFSGVSVIEMSPELDAGDIIAREKENISPFDTAGMLHDRLAARGASLLLKAIDALAKGTAESYPQDSALATYAPMLGPEDEELDWRNCSVDIYNRIRGLNPWPGAYTTFQGRRLKVWRAARPEPAGTDGKRQPPGTILAVEENSLTVATGDGSISLIDLQPAGKKPMNAASFCCGYRIEAGSRFDGV
jgi:methionyl-tRNA formyltransferase